MQFVRKLISIIMLASLIAACGSPEERAVAYLAKAQEYYDAEDYLNAKLEARNAAQIEPRNADARYLLALIAEQEGDFRKMIGHLQVAVDADPKHVEARIKLGGFYYFAQAFDEAETEANAVMELAPDNPNARLLNARILIQQEKMPSALKEIETALSLAPDSVEAILLHAAYYAEDDSDRALNIVYEGVQRLDKETAQPLRQLRILLLSKAERYEDVETEYKSLIRDFPDNEAYPVQLARVYRLLNRNDDAEAVLRSIVEMDTENVGIKLGLIQFLAATSSPEKAEESLKAFIAESPDQSKLQLVLARQYEATDRIEEAISTYGAVVELDSKSEDGLVARNRIASLKLVAGEAEEAQALIEQILADVPDNADALFLRASLSLVNGNTAAAISDLRTVIRKEPDSQRAMYLMARAYLQSDQRVLAIDAYRRLLDVNPSHENAAKELVAIYIDENDPSAAEELLRQQKDAQADSVMASARLVELLLREGKFLEAEEEARSMIGEEDTTGAADFTLARALYAQEKFEEAVVAYKQTLSKAPAASQALEGLVAALAAQDKTDEAASYLKSHLAKYPEQTVARFLLGKVEVNLGNLSEARKLYEKVLEEQPAGTFVVYSSLAGTYTDADERIRIYKRGFAALPSSQELVLLIGGEYEAQNRFEDAIAFYDEALVDNPNMLIAKNNLAALLLDFRDDQTSWEKALKLAEGFENSGNPALIDTLGWGYYRLGDHEQAINYLEQSVAALDEAPVLHFHLGMAYAAVSRNEEARKELARAIDGAPEGIEVLWLAEAEQALAGLN